MGVEISVTLFERRIRSGGPWVPLHEQARTGLMNHSEGAEYVLEEGFGRWNSIDEDLAWLSETVSNNLEFMAECETMGEAFRIYARSGVVHRVDPVITWPEPEAWSTPANPGRQGEIAAAFERFTDGDLARYLALCECMENGAVPGLNARITRFGQLARPSLEAQCLALNEDLENTLHRIDATLREYPPGTSKPIVESWEPDPPQEPPATRTPSAYLEALRVFRDAARALDEAWPLGHDPSPVYPEGLASFDEFVVAVEQWYSTEWARARG